MEKKKSLEYFYKAFHPALSLFAFKYVNDRSIAEEIASDAFIKTWKMHWKLNSYPAIRAYLYKTVRPDCVHTLKREQRRNLIHQNSRPSAVTNDTPFDHLVRSETYRLIHNLLKDLPPGQQRVIKMYYLEGKKAGQISRELHSHPNTIATQKKRGLDNLQKKLKEQGILRHLASAVTRLFKLPVAPSKDYPLIFS